MKSKFSSQYTILLTPKDVKRKQEMDEHSYIFIEHNFILIMRFQSVMWILTLLTALVYSDSAYAILRAVSFTTLMAVALFVYLMKRRFQWAIAYLTPLILAV